MQRRIKGLRQKNTGAEDCETGGADRLGSIERFSAPAFWQTGTRVDAVTSDFVIIPPEISRITQNGVATAARSDDTGLAPK